MVQRLPQEDAGRPHETVAVVRGHEAPFAHHAGGGLTGQAQPEQLSLFETDAGFIMFMNLLLFEAIPTPPMLLLYAVPSFDSSPIPKTEYGEYAPYEPFV